MLMSPPRSTRAPVSAGQAMRMASIARVIFPTLDNACAPGELERLIGEGRTGSKAGSGFHEWGEGEARALVDARNAEVIRHLQRMRRSGGA